MPGRRPSSAVPHRSASPAFRPILGVGVALSVDAVVGCREDVVNLAERSDGLVEVQAERGKVVDRGLRHAPPRPHVRRRLGGGA